MALQPNLQRILQPILQPILQISLPQPALLLAGGFGGPLIIGAFTPLRNACTLASQDATCNARQIMGRVFSMGFRSGWTGAWTPAAAAAMQFTMLGPGYHLYLNLLGSPAPAVVAGALTETFITYASSTRNAQLMHNQASAGRDTVPVRPMMPTGPGFTALLLRNGAAMAGIRVISDPLSRMLQWMVGADTKGAVSPQVKTGGDFLASVLCGAFSMPFNQIYNMQVTSAACLNGTPMRRVTLALRFLRSQYLETTASGSVRLRHTMLRDALLRSSYIGCAYCSFAIVERMALHFASNGK
eukprot:CAMPEP_0172681978 /NCGR_PEP_ID=MMETSP1074-20121228/17830_1 /TAXON_ID=2916 /ORGANISM="Ceratium fusus, Strain PA161109" /LENGTH=298 /DNA_ID=CAMNT_0013500567 /DNA_START=10 /DNA_END=906 /DNA_ORIENTATION=+